MNSDASLLSLILLILYVPFLSERMLSISWHGSSNTIVTGGIDNIRLWSVESGNALQRITIARQSADKPTIVWAVAILKVCFLLYNLSLLM